MWEPGPGIEISGHVATAGLPRRIVDGFHEYPTAVLRLPIGPGERRKWRIGIRKMSNGMAIGLRDSRLKEGRVFGRTESVDQVWWICNTGHLYNGNQLLKAEGLGFGSEVGSRDLNFGQDAAVEVIMEKYSLSFRVNQGKRSEPIAVQPAEPTAESDRVLFFSVQMLDQGDQIELLDCDPDVIIEGELEKRPSSTIMLNIYQPRWFQLTRKGIIYRTERADPAGKVFEFAGVTGFSKVGPLNLTISHKTKEFFVRTPSRSARDAWYKALEYVQSTRKAGASAQDSHRKPEDINGVGMKSKGRNPATSRGSGSERTPSPTRAPSASEHGSLLSIETLPDHDGDDEPQKTQGSRNGAFRPKALEIKSVPDASSIAASNAWMTPKGERGISRTPSSAGARNLISKFMNS